jgi:2-polyprenyl-3-methyl-5-hydroxy-6-metoxy-1,4-benzoquinol methylase
MNTTFELSEQVKSVINSHEYYRDKGFESFSGMGSFLQQTEDVRKHLPIIFEKFNIKSITDSPCGDWNWMKLVNLEGIDYIGYDVVDEVLELNIQKYQKENIKFEWKDIINEDIRESDLIICRDFMFHVSNENVSKLLKNFKNSGSTYLLTTSFEYVNVNENFSSDVYGFRKINLKASPFNFGEPVYSFIETNPNNEGRGMYLWKIN